jgi:hypothetical protein
LADRFILGENLLDSKQNSLSVFGYLRVGNEFELKQVVDSYRVLGHDIASLPFVDGWPESQKIPFRLLVGRGR